MLARLKYTVQHEQSVDSTVAGAMLLLVVVVLATGPQPAIIECSKGGARQHWRARRSIRLSIPHGSRCGPTRTYHKPNAAAGPVSRPMISLTMFRPLVAGLQILLIVYWSTENVVFGPNESGANTTEVGFLRSSVFGQARRSRRSCEICKSGQSRACIPRWTTLGL